MAASGPRVRTSPERDFIFENKIIGGTVPREYVPAVEKGLKGAVTNGVLLASRLTIPIKVVGGIEDGVPWLVDKLRGAGAPPPLEATLRTVTSSLRARLA